NAQQRMAVTELMQPGRTMAVTWTPTHAGNWVFHCHLAVHFDGELSESAAKVMGVAQHEGPAHTMHNPTGMAGLIIGIEVKPRAGVTEARAQASQRNLTLTLSKTPPDPQTKRQCITMELRDGGKI